MIGNEGIASCAFSLEKQDNQRDKKDKDANSQDCGIFSMWDIPTKVNFPPSDKWE